MPDDFAGGSDLTIADLYAEFEQGLSRYARSLTHDADRTDDLVQLAFIRSMSHLELLKQLNRYQRRAWLYQTLKNLFLDQLRARQRERLLVEQMLQLARLEAPPDYSLALPEDLLEQVPERYRELLHQRFVLAMTSEEIGQELGIPAATVRSRLRLVIQWLRVHSSEFL